MLALPVHPNILLADAIFRANVIEVQVPDGELVLAFRDGHFFKVLEPGRYLYWKSKLNYRFERYSLKDATSAQQLEPHLRHLPALARWLHHYRVEPHELGLLVIDGVYQQQYGPGTYYFWQNGQLLNWHRVNTQLQYLEVLAKGVRTKDLARIQLKFQLAYRIVDAPRAVLQQRFIRRQLQEIVRMAIHDAIAQQKLKNLMAARPQLSAEVHRVLNSIQASLGIELLKPGGIQHLQLPEAAEATLKRVLTAEMRQREQSLQQQDEAKRRRQLRKWAREGEKHPSILRWQELAFLERIAAHIDALHLSGEAPLLAQLRKLFDPDANPQEKTEA